MQVENEETEAEVAAARRRALRAALERERDGYRQRKLDARVREVEAQLRALDDPEDRPSSEASEPGEEQAAGAPVERAVESKPRRTARK